MNLIRSYVRKLLEIHIPTQEQDVELSPEEEEKWGWLAPMGKEMAKKYAAQGMPEIPPEAEELLGKERDWDIAQKFGIPVEKVGKARLIKGIQHPWEHLPKMKKDIEKRFRRRRKSSKEDL